MKKHLAHIALVVPDYDRAIDFYSKALDFMLIEDTDLGHGKRWVTMAPPGATECSLLLAKATTEEQMNHVGNQTGGRVFLFLFTDDLSEIMH